MNKIKIPLLSMLFISFFSYSCENEPVFYFSSDVIIKDTYHEKVNNILYIAYATKMETSFYSAGVGINLYDSINQLIEISFYRKQNNV